jgi:hypothetical protein
LTNDRFIRWQGQTLSQLSTALSLFSGLSVAGLGFLFSLARESSFKPSGIFAVLFLIALLSFLISSLAGSAAVITRLLDFRLTAQKTRKTTEEPLTFFGTDSSGYGRATWRLFWTLTIFFSIGVMLSSIAVGYVYLCSIFRAIGF